MAASASLSLYTQQTTGYLQRITLVCIQELSSAMLFQSLADRIEASIHEFFLGQISSSRLLFQPSRFFLAYRVLLSLSPPRPVVVVVVLQLAHMGAVQPPAMATQLTPWRAN